MNRYAWIVRLVLIAMLFGTSIGNAGIPARATPLSTHSADTASDEQAIEQVVTQAETAELALPYPTMGAVATDDASVQSAMTRAASVLNTLYVASSPRLADRLTQVQHALQGERQGGFRMLSAGISNVVFDSVSVNGASATVSLTFTAHAAFVVTEAGGKVLRYAPSNNMLGSLTLTKTGNGWRIMNEVNTFAPGSEP